MPSILIIDDDVALLAHLGAQLEAAGYQVAKSSDLRLAEQLYAEDRPDMVLLEVRAEGGQGWELLPRLAAESPVIVLSGAGREEDVVRGFAAGAADYVSKPYRSEELLARVRARLAAAPQPVAPLAPPPALPLDKLANRGAEGPALPLDKLANRGAEGPAPRRSRRPDPIDESVFMSEAEEMALLRIPPEDAAAPAAPEAGPDSAGAENLGPRLRAERLRRHLTLVQVENELKIRISYLQALEDEKFTLLPRGPVALQMVRSYAGFLGLDAASVADEFRREHYVEPIEPPPALGGARLPRNLPPWLIWLAAIILALAVAVGGIYTLDPDFFTRLPALIQGLWEQLPL